MAEKDIYYFWTRATPLWKSFSRFASPQKRKRYEYLLAEESPHARFGKFGPYVKDNPSRSFSELIEIFRQDHPIESAEELTALSEELKLQTISWIQEGLLKAYGFAVPRTPEAQPVEVPLDLWNSRVSWENNFVEGQGLRIDAVRVFPSHWLEPDETKRPGRPSRVDEVLRAYENLISNGKIDFATMSLKAVASLVQKRTQELAPNHPDGLKGIGDKAIQNAISEDFGQRKEAAKKL